MSLLIFVLHGQVQYTILGKTEQRKPAGSLTRYEIMIRKLPTVEMKKYHSIINCKPSSGL